VSDAKLKLAEAEKERRKRLAQTANAELDKPQGMDISEMISSGLSAEKQASRYIMSLGEEFSEGLMMMLPSATQDFLRENIGAGVSAEQRKSRPVGGMERGMQYAGTAAPMVAAPLLATYQKVSMAHGVIRGIMQDISKFAISHPGLYLGGEAGGALGAGAAGQAAIEGGATSGEQLAAEVAGGMGGGMLATIGPRSFRALREGIRANLTPFTEEGGMVRGARQMQERAGGSQTAAKYAESLDNIPEGVTPAQWVGDERLMAQEAYLLDSNPRLANQVRGELEDARLIAQNELRDEFGQPRTRRDWERIVFERVAPAGTKITPGQTDEMLDQAYKAFGPLYDEVKGFGISTAGLGDRISTAVYSPSLMVSEKERRIVTTWFNDVAKSFTDKIEFDEIPSEMLVRLRSKVRDERRSQFRRGQEDRADLLGAVEAEITKRLESGLPDDIRKSLQKTDAQYRKYKVIESGVYSAGDANLSPEQVSQAIRAGGMTSNSQYARGVNEATQELRQLSLAGRSTEEVLGDPQRAELFIRGLSSAELPAVHADFVGVLIRRATKPSSDMTIGGASFTSGRQLAKDLHDNMKVMKSLGIPDDEIARLRGMATNIQKLEKKSPAAVAQLFEDGPATIMQLAATLAGAKSGQHIAGRGMGSSLVLAHFMSNRARRSLASLTSDEAQRLMEDAVTDSELYKALLTKDLSEYGLKESARYLESWLLASAFYKVRGEQRAKQEQSELPMVAEEHPELPEF